jgi:hypothetical protein
MRFLSLIQHDQDLYVLVVKALPIHFVYEAPGAD